MSQVLQWTQFDGFRLMRLPFGCVESSTISYTFADKILARAAEFFYASCVANIGVVDDRCEG